MKSLSVITLTKNRASYLRKCLGSLVGQLGGKDEIIIIDNYSTDTTQEVVKNYQSQLPIHYYRTSIVGYPHLYNLAVGESSRDILIFLDDDCVASKNYISAVLQAHKKFGDAVIQGQTYSLPPHNIYAEIMGDHYQNWLQVNKISKDKMRTFDNKNASVPRSILKKYGMFLETLTSGSEDIELGIRLRRQGVPIVFDPTVIAYHHERSTLQGFLQQHLRIARSEGKLDRSLFKTDKIYMIYKPKLLLHMQSILRREEFYVTQGRISDFLLLPFLYILLLGIRVWGYSIAR